MDHWLSSGNNKSDSNKSDAKANCAPPQAHFFCTCGSPSPPSPLLFDSSSSISAPCVHHSPLVFFLCVPVSFSEIKWNDPQASSPPSWLSLFVSLLCFALRNFCFSMFYVISQSSRKWLGNWANNNSSISLGYSYSHNSNESNNNNNWHHARIRIITKMSDQAAIRPMSNVQFVPRPWILYPSPVHVVASVSGQVCQPVAQIMYCQVFLTFFSHSPSFSPSLSLSDCAFCAVHFIFGWSVIKSEDEANASASVAAAAAGSAPRLTNCCAFIASPPSPSLPADPLSTAAAVVALLSMRITSHCLRLNANEMRSGPQSSSSSYEHFPSTSLEQPKENFALRNSFAIWRGILLSALTHLQS